MTVFALVAARAALRVITAFVFANGIAALAVAGISWPFMLRPDTTWVTSLFQFSLEVAIVSLASAIASWALMPSAAAIRRRDGDEGPGRVGETLLLAGLAIAAVLQVPALLNWWTADRALLRELVGSGSDPLGFNLVPAAMLFSLPAIATVALVTFVVTSMGATLAPRSIAASILISGIILQTGLVLVEYVALGAAQDVGRAVTQTLESAPATLAAQAASWVARHDRLARDVTARIAPIFIGYLVVLIISSYASRTAVPANGTGFGLAADPDRLPGGALAHPPISQASATFDQSQYVLRVRNAFIALIVPSFAQYDIQTIPPTARTRFSFSWATGVLRREPSGPEVVQIKAAERRGVFKRTYLVTEVATGTMLGKLVPCGLDWEIVDACGRVISTVVQTTASFEREQYVMKVGHTEICRLTWIGQIAASAGEFEVEYLPAAGEQFDRALPIALAPVLERLARRRQQWSS